MTRGRDIPVDLLRGLAIFTMIAANLAATVLAEPHPLGLRLYGSFAAPLFVTLSGTMVALTAEAKGYTLGHYLVRGGLIVATGAFIDVAIWQVFPFTSFDVLYLIGVSVPIAYLVLRLPPAARWVVILGVFAGTPALQAVLGYAPYPVELGFSGGEPFEAAVFVDVLRNWLVDGWFPLFPWLGFSLLGATLLPARRRYDRLAPAAKRRILVALVALTGLGSALWWAAPGDLLVREGYSEMFYPPTAGFLLTSAGTMGVLFVAVSWRPVARAFAPLRVMGESALLAYIVHLALIAYVFSAFWLTRLSGFLVAYAVLAGAILIEAYGVRLLKTRVWKRRPYLVRFLLGG